MNSIEKLVKLKNDIQEGTVGDSLLIFVWEDNPFIAHSYIDEIAKIHGLEPEVIDDFESEFRGVHEDIFGFDDGRLKIYTTDKFNCNLIDELPFIKNCAVICKEISDSTEFSLEVAGIPIYAIPKLKEWQIKNYIKHRCPNLSQVRIDWLCDITKLDIYRIENEIDKIAIYPPEFQDKIFDNLEKDGNFADLNQRRIYDLTNPITSRNKYKMVDVLKDIENMNINEYSLVSILKDSFELLIKIQFHPFDTEENICKELKIEPKRYKAIKWNCGKYTDGELISIYKFLNDFDYNLKSGNLDISTDRLIDYIICKIMS